MNFPEPLEIHQKHFPNKEFNLTVRSDRSDGHNYDPDSFIGNIPKNTPYMTITLRSGSWNSNTWDQLQTAYKNEGYQTHLRKTSGTTKTRSGTRRHAPTQLYVWESL